MNFVRRDKKVRRLILTPDTGKEQITNFHFAVSVLKTWFDQQVQPASVEEGKLLNISLTETDMRTYGEPPIPSQLKLFKDRVLTLFHTARGLSVKVNASIEVKEILKVNNEIVGIEARLVSGSLVFGNFSQTFGSHPDWLWPLTADEKDTKHELNLGTSNIQIEEKKEAKKNSLFDYRGKIKPREGELSELPPTLLWELITCKYGNYSSPEERLGEHQTKIEKILKKAGNKELSFEKNPSTTGYFVTVGQTKDGTYIKGVLLKPGLKIIIKQERPDQSPGAKTVWIPETLKIVGDDYYLINFDETYLKLKTTLKTPEIVKSEAELEVKWQGIRGNQLHRTLFYREHSEQVKQKEVGSPLFLTGTDTKGTMQGASIWQFAKKIGETEANSWVRYQLNPNRPVEYFDVKSTQESPRIPNLRGLPFRFEGFRKEGSKETENDWTILADVPQLKNVRPQKRKSDLRMWLKLSEGKTGVPAKVSLNVIKPKLTYLSPESRYYKGMLADPGGIPILNQPVSLQIARLVFQNQYREDMRKLNAQAISARFGNSNNKNNEPRLSINGKDELIRFYQPKAVALVERVSPTSGNLQPTIFKGRPIFNGSYLGEEINLQTKPDGKSINRLYTLEIPDFSLRDAVVDKGAVQNLLIGNLVTIELKVTLELKQGETDIPFVKAAVHEVQNDAERKKLIIQFSHESENEIILNQEDKYNVCFSFPLPVWPRDPNQGYTRQLIREMYFQYEDTYLQLDIKLKEDEISFATEALLPWVERQLGKKSTKGTQEKRTISIYHRNLILEQGEFELSTDYHQSEHQASIPLSLASDVFTKAVRDKYAKAAAFIDGSGEQTLTNWLPAATLEHKNGTSISPKLSFTQTTKEEDGEGNPIVTQIPAIQVKLNDDMPDDKLLSIVGKNNWLTYGINFKSFSNGKVTLEIDPDDQNPCKQSTAINAYAPLLFTEDKTYCYDNLGKVHAIEKASSPASVPLKISTLSVPLTQVIPAEYELDEASLPKKRVTLINISTPLRDLVSPDIGEVDNLTAVKFFADNVKIYQDNLIDIDKAGGSFDERIRSYSILMS